MNQDEIIRRNVAIALYMGWKRSKSGNWHHKEDCRTSDGVPAFHADGRLLMDALDEVQRMGGLSTEGYYEDGEFHFSMEPGHQYDLCVKGRGKTLMDAIFAAASSYCLSQQKD